MDPTFSESPRTEATPTSSSIVKPLFDKVDWLIKIAGAIAVFGYLSLRSHLNLLGVPFQQSLGYERYLMESYQFFAAVCYSPDLLILILLVCTIVSFTYRQRGASTRSHKFFGMELPTNRLQGFWRAGGVPLISFITVCVLFVRELQLLTRSGTDVVVGTLLQSSDGSGIAAREFRPDGENLFLYVISFCAAGFLFHHIRPQNVGYVATILWRISYVSLILLSMQLPVIYGTFLRPTTYNKVEIRQNEHRSTCGILIVDSNERLQLWRAKNGRGWIETLPAKEAEIRVISAVDILAEAGKSLKTMEDIPSCDE